MAHLDRVERRNSRGYAEGRYYETPLGLLPSVTTILSVIAKPALPAWAAKLEREMVLEAVAQAWEQDAAHPFSPKQFVKLVNDLLPKAKAHRRELDKASEIGTEAHAYCEWWLNQQLGKAAPEPKIRDEALWAAMAFQDWAKSVELQPLLTEGRVWSGSRRYAGTFDIIADATIKGKRRRILTDIKTGKAIYDEAKLQVAALIRAWMDTPGRPPHLVSWPDGLVIRLPKVIGDPAFEVSPLIGYEEQQDLLKVFLAARDLWVWQDACNKQRKAKDN